MSAADNLKLVRSYFELLNRRGATADWIEQLLALVASDYVYRNMGTGHVIHGAEGIRVGWTFHLQAFPDYEVTITNISAFGDDAVVVEYTWRGTHTGEVEVGGRIDAPTGRRVEQQRCSLAKVRDGRWVEEREYYNTLS